VGTVGRSYSGRMEFLPYFQSRRTELIALLQKLVKLESPSSDKKAVDACSTFIVKQLRDLEARVTCLPQKEIGDLTLAEFPGKNGKDMGGRTLLLAHTDTVWPIGTLRHMPCSIQGNTVSGPGVLDMKSGLVMIIAALQALRKQNLMPRHSIAVFLNSYEEVGNAATDRLIRDAAVNSGRVLCLEPALTGGGLKLRRKGRLVVRLEASGKAAHAGNPELGISAIDELTSQLGAIRRLRSQGLTLNTGFIQGGQAANVVAEHAWALLDIRFWTPKQERRVRNHIQEALPLLPGACISWSIERHTPPMEHTPGSAHLLARIRRIARSMGMELPGGKTGGGSDASIAAQLGIPTIDGLGPEGGGIHAESEHILLSSLIERTALLARLLLEL
jgi:glutamate carboxypeptidase